MLQTTSGPPAFAYSPVQNGYQPLTDSEIYAIKKQYLGLLPPPQVIDICLTFEAHAPLHVKSSIWPYDIRAEIAAILARKAQESRAQIPDGKQPTTGETSNEKTPQPDASTSKPSSPTPSTGAGPSTASPSRSSVTQLPARPPPPSAIHYPHQPYYHPSYPHASYYAPHTPYSYPHAYPPYPPQTPVPYSPNPPAQPSPFIAAPLTHSHPPPDQRSPLPPPLNAVDDLPSYEEMIVEALIDCGDPEGCAPKALFSWMAMHYPLQTNFRPSASQALQKAFKRGRLEKGNNGKYRLNDSWEGGNTSRRTTRRPQTLSQATAPGSQGSQAIPPSSPFTHAPLIPHGSQMRPPHPGQPPGYSGYPYGYYYHGTPSQPAGQQVPSAQKQASEHADHETGEGSDAWEAAQNILKAINFGQLLRMPDEDTADGSGTVSTAAEHQSVPSDEVVDNQTAPASGDHATRGSGIQVELKGEERAALQAQLALLAAQLAELADVNEDELSQDLNGIQGPLYFVNF
ncbi:hypothetical protein J3A83DRAFT_4355676 [Scleroderma citrinum]